MQRFSKLVAFFIFTILITNTNSAQSAADLEVTAATEKNFIKACNEKNAESCLFLARYYGKELKPIKTIEYYQKACDLNEMRSCNVLGVSQIYNDDLYEARKYFVKACEASFTMGCYNLGWVEAQWQNYVAADKYYKIACDNKLKEACENILVIADFVKEELKKEKETPVIVECNKALKTDFIPLAEKPQTSEQAEFYYKIGKVLTKVNYNLFNRKKECGASDIALPAKYRLPYTGIEQQYM
jgi:TPR repeat protein